MKTLVIGDIHGCYSEMQRLIDKAGLTSDDQIIALGDIFDRGPDPISVIKFFNNNTNAQSLMGNHELNHIRFLKGKARLSIAQKITRKKLGNKYEKVLSGIADFPTYLKIEDAILIHAFLEPGVLLEDQKKNILTGSKSSEIYLKKKYKRAWYKHYEGDKLLIAGHHDYSKKGKPLIYKDKVFLIDTGCCYGKKLTGILLPDFKIISVKSRDNYWSQAMKEYAR